MAKIGICACYTNHNYGSMLQSYATQKAFEAEGFDCEMIRYRKKKTIGFILKQIPRIFNRITISDKKLVIEKKISLRKYPEAAKEDQIRKAAFDRFQEQYFTKLSPEYYGYEALKKGAAQYAGVISGSDQVWSPSALATHFYDLTFVPDGVVRASYASSFGVKEIPAYQIQRTRYYLNRIPYVSVREKVGQTIVKQLTGRDVPNVCDPTFLFTGKQWEQYIPVKEIVKEPYVFAYFLGANPEHRELVSQFAREEGIKVVAVHHMDTYVPADEGFGDIVMSNVGPEEFLNLIRGAEYVCTDSFHGTIFSVLNHKQFLIFNRYSEQAKDSKNSRIDSLCQVLGLSERRYRKHLGEEIMKPIDYDSVDARASELRKESFSYIHEVSEAIRMNDDD